MWKALKEIDSKPFAEFAEGLPDELPQNLITACTNLVIQACDGTTNDTLASLRTHKYLAGITGTLLGLPPTESALTEHIKRAALSTIIYKQSHIAQPTYPPHDNYGWQLYSTFAILPKYSTARAFPESLEKTIACKYRKKCSSNCNCVKNNVSCYKGCQCLDTAPRCTRAAYSMEDSSNEDES